MAPSVVPTSPTPSRNTATLEPTVGLERNALGPDLQSMAVSALAEVNESANITNPAPDHGATANKLNNNKSRDTKPRSVPLVGPGSSGRGAAEVMEDVVLCPNTDDSTLKAPLAMVEDVHPVPKAGASRSGKGTVHSEPVRRSTRNKSAAQNPTVATGEALTKGSKTQHLDPDMAVTPSDSASGPCRRSKTIVDTTILKPVVAAPSKAKAKTKTKGQTGK